MSASVGATPAHGRMGHHLDLLRTFGGSIGPVRPLVLADGTLFAAPYGSQLRVHHVAAGTPALAHVVAVNRVTRLSATQRTALATANAVATAAGRPTSTPHVDSIVALQANPRNAAHAFVLPALADSFILFNLQTGKRVRAFTLPTTSQDSTINTKNGLAKLAIRVITNLITVPGDDSFVYITVRDIYIRDPTSNNIEDATEQSNTTVLRDLHRVYRFSLADNTMLPLGSASTISTTVESMDRGIISAEDPITAFTISLDRERIAVGRGNYIEVLQFAHDIASFSPMQADISQELLPISEIKLSLNPGNLNEIVSCLEIEPHGKFLAAGSSVGRIHICHVFDRKQQGNGIGMIDGNSPKADVVKTVLHWHPSIVNSICFSADGQQLLSVGKESVLVIWQIETRQKRFLPRLGGEILTVGYLPDQKSFMVSLRNSIIHFIAQQNLKIWMTLGAPNVDDAFEENTDGSDAAFKKRQASPLITSARGMLMLREPTGVQLLDASSTSGDMSTAMRVKVIPKIYSANADQHRDTPKGIVDHAMASSDGKWLLTVEKYTNTFVDSAVLKFKKKEQQKQNQLSESKMEVTDENETKSSSVLDADDNTSHLPYALSSQRQNVIKFYSFVDQQEATISASNDSKPQTGTYALSSLVNEAAVSHGFITCAAITNATTDPSSDYHAVTGFSDGTFKIWSHSRTIIKTNDSTSAARQEEQASNSSQGGTWTCAVVGSFSRSEKASACAFSKDGSVLAIAFGNSIALWSPTTGRLLDVHVQRYPIACVLFPGDSRMVVLSTTGTLRIVDLVLRSVLWEIDGNFTDVAPLPTIPSRFCALGGIPSTIRDSNLSVDGIMNDEISMITDDTPCATLYTFDVSTPTPLAAIAIKGPLRPRGIAAVSGLKRGITDVTRTDLVVLLRDRAILEVYGDGSSATSGVLSTTNDVVQEPVKRLQALFGHDSTMDEREESVLGSADHRVLARNTTPLVAGAVHSAPAPARLATTMLRAALRAASGPVTR